MRNLTSAGDHRLLLRRIVIYGAAIFFIGIIQCAFFSRLKLFGVTPDLILGALLTILLLDNKYAAAVSAVGAGYFIDALGSSIPSFSALFYLFAVAVLFVMAQKLLSKLPSFILLLLAALPVRASFTYFNLCLTFGKAAPISCIWTVILPEALCTVLFCIPVYFLIKLCTVPISSRSKFTF